MVSMGRKCNGAENFLQQFGKRVTKLRVPLSGSMDLTHRCNLRCVHRYLDPQNPKHHKLQAEMKTNEVLGILDEITDAGCLYLLLTGGEPLVRKDFPEIYQHAKEKGLLITLFTNGTLLSDKTLDIYDDLPPKAIEISFYGATASTYEKITGVKGSFDRCVTGIQKVLAHGLNLRLKTILMTANHHEFVEMEQMAKNFGAPFRFDPAIFPRFNGDLLPLELRISPEGVNEREFSDQGRALEWKELYAHFRDLPSSDAMYQCGTGLTYFHIDPYGNLQPCLMSTGYRYSLKDGSFLEGWNGKMPNVREITLSANHTCNDYSKHVLCGYCPPFFELENASEASISDFLCSLGQLRHERLQSIPDRRDV